MYQGLCFAFYTYFLTSIDCHISTANEIKAATSVFITITSSLKTSLAFSNQT